jgi:hypothetical protein
MRGELIDNAGGANMSTFFALLCCKSLLQDGMSITVMVHPAEIVILGMVRLGEGDHTILGKAATTALWIVGSPVCHEARLYLPE